MTSALMELIGNCVSLFHTASVIVIGVLMIFTFGVIYLCVRFWDQDIFLK